jgi:hypothetical protein
VQKDEVRIELLQPRSRIEHLLQHLSERRNV